MECASSGPIFFTSDLRSLSLSQQIFFAASQPNRKCNKISTFKFSAVSNFSSGISSTVQTLIIRIIFNMDGILIGDD
ncbi:hypothetical protein GIB67_022557 [Kingdonia uniflora]|uniref:Uncharacterized protein n=1 Tax=Kingdonia uniflora TaxID=39325 RepID=A0A7J7L7F9_9MAGN|nr:hypothetical protein GIB67_022557 [Kingdonia uniflora]